MLRPHRSAVALIAATLSVSLMAADDPLPLPGSAPLQVIAGEVTISAPAGLSGIRLVVPSGASSVRYDNTLSTVDELYDGEFGLVQIVQPRIEGAACTTASMCALHRLEVHPDWYRDAADLEETNGLLEPGYGCREDQPDGSFLPCALRSEVLDIYIATDAPIEFTLRFPELAGSVDYVATGTVTGVYEQVPVEKCPTDDCERWAIGHQTRTMGSSDTHASVHLYAFTRASHDRLAGVVGAGNFSNIGLKSCVYPSFLYPETSSDPTDHPDGCDSTPSISGEGLAPNSGYTESYLLTLQDRAIGQSNWSGNLEGDEPVYVGFNARNQSLLPGFEGAQNAWAVWLEQGIG